MPMTATILIQRGLCNKCYANNRTWIERCKTHLPIFSIFRCSHSGHHSCEDESCDERLARTILNKEGPLNQMEIEFLKEFGYKKFQSNL